MIRFNNEVFDKPCVSKKMQNDYIFAIKVLKNKTFGVKYTYLTSNEKYNFDFHKKLKVSEMNNVVKVVNSFVKQISGISILDKSNDFFRNLVKFKDIKPYYQGGFFCEDMDVFVVKISDYRVFCFFDESNVSDVQVLMFDWDNSILI